MLLHGSPSPGAQGQLFLTYAAENNAQRRTKTRIGEWRQGRARCVGGRDGGRRRGKCGERKERKGPVLHLRGVVPRRVSRSSSLRPRRRGVAGCSWHRNYSANYRVAFPNPAHGPRRPSRPISPSICPNASISLPAIPRQSAGESPDNSHGDRREKGGGG